MVGAQIAAVRRRHLTTITRVRDDDPRPGLFLEARDRFGPGFAALQLCRAGASLETAIDATFSPPQSPPSR
jgi:hypothetical protein